MKINELAKKAGVTTSAIRYYEQQGLLDARHVRREENNYRDYNEEAVEQFLIIKEAQAAGFTLAEIKELDNICKAGELADEETAIFFQRKIAKVGEKIAELRHIQAYLKSKLAEMLQDKNGSS
jgi:MerR family transcriptional regulator, copper efflux regulator